MNEFINRWVWAVYGANARKFEEHKNRLEEYANFLGVKKEKLRRMLWWGGQEEGIWWRMNDGAVIVKKVETKNYRALIADYFIRYESCGMVRGTVFDPGPTIECKVGTIFTHKEENPPDIMYYVDIYITHLNYPFNERMEKKMMERYHVWVEISEVKKEEDVVVVKGKGNNAQVIFEKKVDFNDAYKKLRDLALKYDYCFHPRTSRFIFDDGKVRKY